MVGMLIILYICLVFVNLYYHSNMARKKQSQVETLFDDRFLESYTGPNLIKDPKVAIMELIANSWDAGASKVDIKWPATDGARFSIADNGHGMTEIQFKSRYTKFAYNRVNEQGTTALIPEDNKSIITSNRPTFGRNGIGRFGAFAFGEQFSIRTWCNNKTITYSSKIDAKTNLPIFTLIDESEGIGHGTEIYVEKAKKPGYSSTDIRREIGMRFLVDPNFEVVVDNERVTFSDVPTDHIQELKIEVENIGEITVKIIDIQDTDKTTQLHGVAWNVNNRLVGECSWKGNGLSDFIDGRREYAKRYVFIIEADCLADSVMPDWTAFIPNNNKYNAVAEKVMEAIKSFIIDLSKSYRQKTFAEIENTNKAALAKISYVSREKWETFIQTVQEECPSISDKDLAKLGDILVTLEKSQSKYSLIQYLSEATSDQLDNLTQIFSKWDIDVAKIVLDEVEYRMTLLEKLQYRIKSQDTDEVHDLQPLFHRGLWIFGPEYETIEYTSNQGMTTVIQELFGDKDKKGSLNRPDFVVLTDGTVGFYGYDKYDDNGGEIGIACLTIVELKKPKIPISDDQRDQAWKYVKELKQKGLIKPFTKVMCYVLGSEVDPLVGERTEDNGQVVIRPLDYDTIIRRANSRLLKLYDKIKAAPFLKDTRINEYIKNKPRELFN